MSEIPRSSYSNIRIPKGGLGTQTIHSLQLCAMGVPKREDGYYPILHEVPYSNSLCESSSGLDRGPGAESTAEGITSESAEKKITPPRVNRPICNYFVSLQITNPEVNIVFRVLLL